MKHISILVVFFTLFACNKNEKKTSSKFLEEDTMGVGEPQQYSSVKKNWNLSDFLKGDTILTNQVDDLYANMSFKEKAAQLIAVADNVEPIYDDLDDILDEGYAGSLLFLKMKDNKIKSDITNFKNYPNGLTKTLFMADAEPSLIKYKFVDYKDSIPSTINIKENDIIKYTQQINQLLSENNIKLNFGTLGDFGGNKSVINNRAWGKTKEEVIKEASTNIKATQESGIGATLKHFPGHGSVKGDSHKKLVYVNGKLSEYENFKSIIQKSNPVAIMVGHIAIKNNRLYSSDLPATLNSLVMKDLLRTSNNGKEYNKFAIHYKGLIVTDAMNMKAVSKIKNADFRALEAGTDIVLMPQKPIKLNEKIQEVLKDKENTLHNQFQESVKRVLRYKICTGLIQ